MKVRGRAIVLVLPIEKDHQPGRVLQPNAAAYTQHGAAQGFLFASGCAGRAANGGVTALMIGLSIQYPLAPTFSMMRPTTGVHRASSMAAS